MTRFAGIGMGYDVKSNQKDIKLTPGPGDYNIMPPENQTFLKKTHNYALQNGGKMLSKTSTEYKNEGIKLVYGYPNSPPNMASPIGATSLISNSIFTSMKGNQTPANNNIIQQNKLAVNANYILMTSTRNSAGF